jgi:hypothetical protein
MTRFQRDQVSALIAQIQDRARPDMIQAQLAQKSRVLAVRRKFDKRLRLLLEEAPRDLTKIDALLSQQQSEIRQVLEKERASADRLLSKWVKQDRERIKRRLKALNALNGLPQILTPIVIDAPFSIYATPSSMLTESDIAPNVSYAKIRYVADSEAGPNPASIKFFFVWPNESSYAAVINANADLIVRGICQAQSSPGFLLGGSASLSLRASLSVYISGKSSYWPAANLINSVSADTNGALLGGTVGGDIDQKYVYSTTNLASSELVVQDGELAIFEVAMWADYSIDDGSIFLDFATSQDYFVICNHLVVGLLTQPAMITGPG